MQVKTVLALFCLCVIHGWTLATDLSLRLNPSFYDDHTNTIYVDVELRYDGAGPFTLADQNYRLFFDSKLLSLNEEMSRSDLPNDLYSGIQFMEILEDLEADEINELPFDNQLGFVNFNIDLQNNSNGGIDIRKEDDWQRIAVLNFQIEDKTSLSQIVWSTSEKTESYATAFVEIMEWLAPNHTEPAQVDQYIDAAFNISDEITNDQLEISPNPANDFITLSLDGSSDQSHDVIIYDVMGKKVKNSVMFKGVNKSKLDITDLLPGTYTVELVNDAKSSTITRGHFIKVDG